MPTYSNTGNLVHWTTSGLFGPGVTGFAIRERLDDLSGVVRTSDAPYIHEPRTVAADNTMTPWVWTPAGKHTLSLGGDWQGTVTVQRAAQSDGSDAVRCGEFASNDTTMVHVLTEAVGAYYRYGFLTGGLVSGTLNGNVEVG